MKSILMNIQYFLMFLAILSCSKDSEQSQVKFSSFTMALEGTIIQGGVAIYGENKESFENFSTIIFPNEGEKFIEITPGVWKFHAFAYTGESGPLTGSLYCDAIDVGLSPGEQEVNLVLSQNNCLEMQSKSAGDPEAAVFAQVVIHSCQSLINEPSDPSNTCNGIYGPQKSFKLKVMEYDISETFMLLKDFTGRELESSCFNETASGIAYTSAILPGTYGPEFSTPLKIIAYDSVDCQGASKEYFMPQGLFGGTFSSFYAYGKNSGSYNEVYLTQDFSDGYVPSKSYSGDATSSLTEFISLNGNQTIASTSNCEAYSLDVVESDFITAKSASKDYNFNLSITDKNGSVVSAGDADFFDGPACTSSITNSDIFQGSSNSTIYFKSYQSGKFFLNIEDTANSIYESLEVIVNSSKITLAGGASYNVTSNYGDTLNFVHLSLSWNSSEVSGQFECSIDYNGDTSVNMDLGASTCDDGVQTSSCNYYIQYDPGVGPATGGIYYYSPTISCYNVNQGGSFTEEVFRVDFTSIVNP